MRQVRDSRLETRNGRQKLPVSIEPLWKQIHPGLFIGYYKGTNGGTWTMRRRIEKDGKKVYEKSRLGIADDYADANGADVLSYSQAHRIVIEKSDQAVTLPQNYTVKQAADDYLEWFRVNSKSYATTETVIKAHVLPQFENRKLDSLTTGEIRDWLNGLVSKDRSKSTANRVLTVFKALLNYGWRQEKVKDNSAWKRVEPFKNAEQAREIFLSAEQCTRLINVCQGGFKELVQAALFSGARPPGELATLRVSDLDTESGTLSLRDGKTGKRVIYLSDEAVTFFHRLTVGKNPDDLLLTKDNGEPWGKSHHIRLMRQAVKVAKLEKETSIYSLRHTHISLALINGVNIQIVAENCGTSVRMIELHYGKFLNSDRRKMFQAMPSFGLTTDNVEPFRKSA